MSGKHEVTVYDRVPAKAAVSVNALEDYLRRSGWLAFGAPSGEGKIWRLTRDIYESPIRTSPNMPAQSMAIAVEYAALLQQRQPSAVLADIAKEEA